MHENATASFLRGFVKAANDAGIKTEDAIQLFKSAEGFMDALKGFQGGAEQAIGGGLNSLRGGLDSIGMGEIADLIRRNPEIAGMLTGGTLGAGAGALLGGEGNRGKGALVGGLAGAGLGGYAGHLGGSNQHVNINERGRDFEKEHPTLTWAAKHSPLGLVAGAGQAAGSAAGNVLNKGKNLGSDIGNLLFGK